MGKLAGETELLLLAAAEGGIVSREALIKFIVLHYGAPPREIIDGYIGLLRLGDEPRILARVEELRRMGSLRGRAVPPIPEVRFLDTGGGTGAFQQGSELVPVDAPALRDILGDDVLLPGDPSLAGALVAEVAGPSPLGASRFTVRGDPRAIDATVRRQAVFLIGAVTLSAVIGLAGLAFLLVSVRREAELARMKSEFVESVSHDLRAPLAVIRLYAETLRTGRVPAGEQEDYAAVVEREAVSLSRLVDRVLDFARIERGTKEYPRQPGDLASIIRRAGAEAEARFPDLDLTVRAPSVPLPGSFDEGALHGAIGNLANKEGLPASPFRTDR